MEKSLFCPHPHSLFLYLDFPMLASLIIPPQLVPGDKVAAVSLSWGGAGDPKYHHRYLAGVRALEKNFGVKVVAMPNTLKGSAFIYNNVRARVDDLHQAFADPDIKAVIPCVGGDDSIRIVDHVDLDLLRKNPKAFIGFSDSTITHFICLTAGLRSYYGPAIMTNLAGNMGPHPYLVDSVRKTFFSREPIGPVDPSTSGWTYEDLSWVMPGANSQLFPALPWTFIQGQTAVTGRLLGGCTEAMAVINGTSIWPPADTWDGAILFLENFGEATSPDMLLNTLRNLGVQGVLGRLNGILFGRPNGVPAERFSQYDEVLMKATKEFGRPDLPIITRMDFGHTDPSFVIPYGAMARIDPRKNTFSIEEAGCSTR
jgi:muramoyltetrapeptide carboxypeptidase LdcA involved in peptidoglycan recycling